MAKHTPNQEVYRRLFEYAPDGIIVASPAKYCLDANPAICKMLGYSREELIGLPASDIVSPEQINNFDAILKRVKTASEYIEEWSFRRKDGSKFAGEVIARLMPDGNLLAMVRDVTGRQQAEEALRESESRLRAIIDTEPECVKLTTADCRIIEMNSAGLRMVQADSFAQVENSDISTLVVEEHRELYRDLTKRVFRGETGILEFQIIGLKGTKRWLDTHAGPLRSGTGEITAFLGITRDITQRRMSEKALRESNDNFHQLADNITDAFWVRSPDMKTIHYISPAFEEIWGRPVETYYKNPDQWQEAIVPEDRPAVLAEYAALTGDARDFEVEYRIARPNGELRSVRSKGFQVRDSSGKVTRLAGVITDLTEQRQLENQFRQSQKMEAVGVLAGGVAHDFNNMLTAINGYSELALRSLPASDPVRSNIEEIKKAGVRATMLTNQLLAFSRRQLLRPELVHINETVAETSNMLKRLIGEDVELECILNPNVGEISVDPGQLSQILMNLAVNARDAMPRGGKLTIETANVNVDLKYAHNHVGVVPGEYVMLAVSDTGLGMTSELQEHIFEPFFTTKATGKGTGLGLSTVYGIVKQSGGGIFVYSEIDHGTTFKVFLPRVHDPTDRSVSGTIAPADTKGTETILLVEDEEIVRSLTKQILESSGYVVREARDGVEALEVFRSAGDIDLVITDVIMPRMGGRELVEQLLGLKPDICVLFASGYTDDVIVRHGMLETNMNFIQKPFSLGEISRKVRDLLDKAQHRT